MATWTSMNLLWFFFSCALNNTFFFVSSLSLALHLLFCSFSFLPPRYLSLARISPLLVSIVYQKNYTQCFPSDNYC